MPRSDRLLDLLRLLRDGRLHRAEDVARALGVSQRTVYRDLDTLIASGVPIAGERGLGYKAVAAVTLPPLNLASAEVEALRRGLRLAAEAGEPGAASLRAKVEAVLPEGAPPPPDLALGHRARASRGFRHLPAARAAIRARQKLRLLEGERARTVRPLRLGYWGGAWMLDAWDEGAGRFVAIRLDALDEVSALPQLFMDEPGRTLADLAAQGS